MKTPIISIIIPVYNAASYLETCLNSIISQTFEDYEVIMIDDGSTDESGIVCDLYSKKDKRFQVIHQKNSGVSNARNVGLTVSQGEYILFVDSDDYIGDKLLEKLTCQISKSNADLIIFGYNEVKQDGIHTVEFHPECDFCNHEMVLQDVLTDKITNFLWNKMYKRILWSNVRFPIGYQYEDLFVLPKVFSRARIITWIPDSLYYYNRTNDNSITGKNNDFSSWNRYNKFRAYTEHEKVAKEMGISLAINWAVSRCIHEGIKALYIDCSDHKLSRDEKNEIYEYLKYHKSKLVSNKYKILKKCALSYPMLFNLYGYLRYCQVRLKSR